MKYVNPKIANFIIAFAIQMLLYLLIVINFRAITQANLLWMTLSDAVIAAMNFFIIRKIATSPNSIVMFFGYTLGSVVGSILGIILSKTILGS